MSERVKERVPQAAFIDRRTFHSCALSVVRQHFGALGLPAPPEIMATDEQWALVSEPLSDENSEEWDLALGASTVPLPYARSTTFCSVARNICSSQRE